VPVRPQVGVHGRPAQEQSDHLPPQKQAMRDVESESDVHRLLCQSQLVMRDGLCAVLVGEEFPAARRLELVDGLFVVARRRLPRKTELVKQTAQAACLFSRGATMARCQCLGDHRLLAWSCSRVLVAPSRVREARVRNDLEAQDENR